MRVVRTKALVCPAGSFEEALRWVKDRGFSRPAFDALRTWIVRNRDPRHVTRREAKYLASEVAKEARAAKAA